ncbi:hypothetical protein NLU13_3139 [Sarocladium strictum]|uniref:Uncharacterized protein n=1 Tax=Sarocladium strictum TaxID=5046 RepID=A0AA39GM96_SARSR|nr:hypothetical protein NLU13_3139 [Sarocladium strictum]
MDASVASTVLYSLLPPEIAGFIHKNILDSRSPFQVVLSQIVLQVRNFINLVAPHFDRLLTQAGIDLSGTNITGVVAVAALVITVLAVLDYVRRMIFWWTRFTFRIVFWAIVVGAAALVWERGLMESAKDAAVLGGHVLGYAAGVKDHWMAEYERYEQQQQQHTMMGGGRGRSSGR